MNMTKETAAIEMLTKGLEQTTALWCILDCQSSPLTGLCDEVITRIENGLSILKNMDPSKKQNMNKVVTDSPFADSYQWRKYGEKSIKKSQHQRSYYRCTYKGCDAKKQVQVISSGEFPKYQVKTVNEHTCNASGFQYEDGKILSFEPRSDKLGSSRDY